MGRPSFFSREGGSGLVEAVVATALVGLALVFALSALSVAARAVARVSERTAAEALARSQMEYAQAQTYLPAPASYPTLAPPQGYSVSAEASSVPGGDASIQRLSVTVRHGGNEVVRLERYKVNR